MRNKTTSYIKLICLYPGIAIVCERKRGTVKCPKGHKIKVLSGFYGRDDTKT